jgi:quinolinate synthase
MPQIALPEPIAASTRRSWRTASLRAKGALGKRVLVLGHHYQRDEVIRHADFRGDSFKLAQEAAARPEAEYIVFCGVHFMAESADILSAPHQKVVLPDLTAGCTMADMAEIRRSRIAGTS